MLGKTGPQEGTKNSSWRLKLSTLEYLNAASSVARGAGTKIIDGAVALHRLLGERLEKMPESRRRLLQFALNEGLDWPEQEAEVYVRLILRGLEEAEKKQQPRK